ncbi:MAG: hypothetical protein HFG32_11385 [Eubacterium sp.]|jgi:hypothetical protein|nr:hypothetical protein [Eubacterium sp.]
MNINTVKFAVPGMDENTQNFYTRLYDEVSGRFVNILSTSPDEIAIISRLIVYMMDKKGGEEL